jgi:hypothetical protein
MLLPPRDGGSIVRDHAEAVREAPPLENVVDLAGDC